jgi:hypothetical protein
MSNDKLVEYTYTEFWIDLPANWQQTDTGQANVLNWHSSEDEASLTISAEFIDIPAGTESVFAATTVVNRKEALEKAMNRPLTILHESSRPHSQVGYDISFGVQVGDEFIVNYAGYVSPRKILHFTLVSKRDKQTAHALYQQLISHLRVKLP